MCKALLGLHACTVCDILSAFAGKGKIRALTILKANDEFKEAFAQLGVQWNLTPNLHVKLEEFVCKLCATNRPQAALMHFGAICSVQGKVMQNDMIYLHVKAVTEIITITIHTNYQAAIWRRSLISDPETPDPVGTGGNSRSNN